MKHFVRLTSEIGDGLFSKWFANGHERASQKYLEKIHSKEKFDTANGFAKKDFKTLKKQYADNAMDEIFNLLHDLSNNVQFEDVYYLGYYEYREKYLESAILFKFTKNDFTKVYVPQMTIFYQAIAHRVRDKNEDVKRSSVLDLFRYCVLELKQIYEPLTDLSINAASKGSKTIVSSLWKDVVPDSEDIDLPIYLMCAECRFNEALYTFKSVGGSFCSKECAKQQWKKLIVYNTYKIF